MSKKIVINTCYGGFNLSAEAKEELFNLGCSHMEEQDATEYFKSDFNDFVSTLTILQIPYRSGKVIIDNHNKYENRDCPYLVQVVEKLKEKANGKHSELKIVEIPDDVEWEIEEYDGKEWVSEKHRTWR